MKRINVSLDTLDPHKFHASTRWGRLDKVLGGIDAAVDAGLRIKINAVALKGVKDDEFHRMVEWCGGRGFDLTFIEVMPLGGRVLERRYIPLTRVRTELAARYARVWETGRRIGFITPLNHGFCESCNGVRLTYTGQLYLCLGREDAADLRTPLRLGDDALREEAVARGKR